MNYDAIHYRLRALGPLRWLHGLLSTRSRHVIWSGVYGTLRAIESAAGVVSAVILLLPVVIVVTVTGRKIAPIGKVDHIGYLAQLPEYYLRLCESEGRDRSSLPILVWRSPCNKPLADKFHEHFIIVDAPIISVLVDSAAPYLRLFRLFDQSHLYYFQPKLYSTTGPALTLNDDERKIGRAMLAEIGIGPDDWFVCFHNRDDAYYANPAQAARNSDIRLAVTAMEEVTRRGGYAIRMGAKVEHSLHDTGNPRIIDITTRPHSPFLDYYLCANCRFFFGTSSGIVMVPLLFNVPVVTANQMPVHAMTMQCGIPYAPKLIVDGHGRPVPYKIARDIGVFSGEICHGVFEAAQALKRAGLTFQENSPEDLRDLVLDMFDVLEGRPPLGEAKPIQDRFRDEFLAYSPKSLTHRGDPYCPLIGARFALRHAELFDL